MSDLEKLFTETRQLVDSKLEQLLPKSETPPERLHEAIRWSIFAGGKRFRPTLLFAVGRAYGASDEKLLNTAAACEMIHTYSLIHDDLPAMDDDDLRRGRETCHVKFDEATAILAGDVLQTLAFKSIADDPNLQAEIKVKLVSELADAAGTPFGMVAGQQFDIEAEGQAISIDELERIHRSKTGAMIEFSVRAAALIAGASENELDAATLYAKKLGLLFQVTDDLLDATQTTETLGKTAGKDLASEKATYPSIYGFEKASALAAEIHAESVLALEGIANETDVLKQLADFILKRTA